MKQKLSPQTAASLSKEFLTLVEIIAALRGPEGCPWDKEQTQSTLTQYAIEEAFELAEAIENGNQQEIKDELGDFFFQVLLQSQVAFDEKHFDLIQVMQNLSEKLVRRHPHVFSDVKVQNTEEVWKNWEQLKSLEKIKPVFSYPRNLPALQAAHKIGIKSKGYKFDWENAKDVLEKVREEFSETEEAFKDLQKNPNAKAHVEEEIGDLLFSIAQFARHLEIEPEQALRKANKKFEDRFNQVLSLAGPLSKEQFSALPSEQKERLWSSVKKSL
jgi:tetrapyrrole methylase family protein/MazG family protein